MTATKRRKPLRWRGGTVHDGEGVACVLRRDGREHARVTRRPDGSYAWTAHACGRKGGGGALTVESAKSFASSWVRRMEAGE